MTVENKELQKKEQQAVEGDAQRMERRPTYLPPTDVYEKDDAIVVVADMPGVSEKDVDIQLDNDTLTITGRVEAAAPEGFDLLYSEFASGQYERTFTLSEDVDRNGIKANMKNGVLRIALPKSEKARPRKIAVETE